MNPLKLILVLLAVLFLVVSLTLAADDPPSDKAASPLNPDRKIIDAHKQIASMSCIPSGIELILKLTGRVQPDNFDLQKSWKNKSTGNFKDFDGKTIEGLTFHKQFGMPRGDKFPLDELFTTISTELNAGRYVEVSLSNGGGWHMWVIIGEEPDGEFHAVSKDGPRTMESHKVKANIRKMKGTDILTYTESSPTTAPSTQPTQ